MKIAWLGKRHYTHKDTIKERFGRVYQVPLAWSGSVEASLELLDYYGRSAEQARDGALAIASTPALSPSGMLGLRKRIDAFQPDVVVASGDCFVGLLALWLARRSGARFVFDVYDDYREFGAYRAFLGWDAYGYLLRRSDLVLYASSALAREHAASTPWALMPNGVDPSAFKPSEAAAARLRVGMTHPGVRWIGYFGGMEPERGSEDLVAAVGLLHARDPSVRLVLCGKQVPGQALDRPWVDYRGSVAHALVPDFINACDVVALPYRRGPIIDMASSCKIAEYLFCERPLVATRTPNLVSNFPVQAGELGAAVCEPGNPDDLARAIDHQLRHAIVASRPSEHTWAAIARETLDTLRRLPAPAGTA